jgi:hypothetical protein
MLGSRLRVIQNQNVTFLVLAARWCHARSRVAGGLRWHDTRQVQRREDLFWFGGDKMDLRRTFDGATWPCGGSSHVGCCWGSVGWFSATGG